MSETLDTLSIDIQVNGAKEAAAQLTELKNSLKNFSFKTLSSSLATLSQATSGLKDFGKLKKLGHSLKGLQNIQIPNIGKQISNIATAADSITDTHIEKIERLVAALQGLKDIKMTNVRINFADGKAETSPIKQGDNGEASKEIGRLSQAFKDLKQMATDLSKAWGLDKLGKAVKASLAPLGKMLGMFGDLARTFGRIAMYRFIRSVIKGITTAAKEGVTNLYFWSDAVKAAVYEGKTFSKIMDGMASSSMYLKNAFGTGLANILVALAPIVDSLAEKIVTLINWINNLFAVLRGDSYYLQAVKTTEKFAEDTKKAAKAVKNLVFGFDELNIVPVKSGSGTSKIPDNIEDMFKKVETEVTPFAKKMKDLFGDIAISWEGFKQNFKFNGETIAKSLVLGLETLVRGVTGFTLGGPLGAVVGTITGVTMGLLMDKAIFDNDGNLSLGELKNSLVAVLGAVGGGILGGILFKGKPGGIWLGASVGSSIALALLDGRFDKALSKLNLEMFSSSLKVVLGAATGALIGWKIAKQNGALIGMTIGTLMTLAATDNGYGVFSNGGLDAMAIVKRLLSILAAATLGVIAWSLTGGNAVAGVLAFNLSLAIGELDWSMVKDAIKDAFDRAKEWFDLQLRNFMHWIKGEQPEQAIKNVQTGKITYRTQGEKYRSEWFNPTRPFEGSFASGGTPATGSLFIAGEDGAGPEFVGQLGGRTQVYNEDQLAGSLSVANEGLINVVIQSANALISAIENKDMSVSIGDRDIADSAARGARLNGRAMVR